MHHLRKEKWKQRLSIAGISLIRFGIVLVLMFFWALVMGMEW